MSRRYGSHPAHLLAHVALFALAGYAIAQVFALDTAIRVVLWMAGAVLLHDAVLWPLYSGADTGLQRLLGSAVNHVRVPLGLSLLLALVFIGTVSGKGEEGYARASGQQFDGYVTRWLIVSAALFVTSAVVFAVRRR
jgi:hypothetical protein